MAAVPVQFSQFTGLPVGGPVDLDRTGRLIIKEKVEEKGGGGGRKKNKKKYLICIDVRCQLIDLLPGQHVVQKN
jgi:hypothetical protein